MSLRLLTNRLLIFICGLLAALPSVQTGAAPLYDNNNLPSISANPYNALVMQGQKPIFSCHGRGERMVWQIKVSGEQNYTLLADHSLSQFPYFEQQTDALEGSRWLTTLTVQTEDTVLQQSSFRCQISSGNRMAYSSEARLCICTEEQELRPTITSRGNSLTVNWESITAHCCLDSVVYTVNVVDITDSAEGENVRKWSYIHCCQLAIHKPLSPCHSYRVEVTPMDGLGFGETAAVEYTWPGEYFSIADVTSSQQGNGAQNVLVVTLSRPGKTALVCLHALVINPGQADERHEEFEEPLIQPDQVIKLFPLANTDTIQDTDTPFSVQLAIDDENGQRRQTYNVVLPRPFLDNRQQMAAHHADDSSHLFLGAAVFSTIAVAVLLCNTCRLWQTKPSLTHHESVP